MNKKILILLLIIPMLFCFGCSKQKIEKDTSLAATLKNVKEYQKDFNQRFPNGYKMKDGLYLLTIYEIIDTPTNTYQIYTQYYLDLYFKNNNLVGLINKCSVTQRLEEYGVDERSMNATLNISNKKFYKYINDNNNVSESYGYIEDVVVKLPFFDFYNYVTKINNLDKRSTENHDIVLTNTARNLNMVIKSNNSYENISFNFDLDTFSSFTINVFYNADGAVVDNIYSYNNFEYLYNSYKEQMIIPRLSQYSHLLLNSTRYSASFSFHKTERQDIKINYFEDSVDFEEFDLITKGEDN